MTSPNQPAPAFTAPPGFLYRGDGLRTTRTIGASAVSYVWDRNASLPVILQDKVRAVR